MGVAFTLGFLLIVILVIGIAGILTGAAVLIVRHVRKQKTQKKYSVSKAIGIVFLFFGVLLSSIPIILGGFAGVGFTKEMSAQKERNNYFTQYEDTAVQIMVKAQSIRDDKIYLNNSFEFNGRAYHQIPGLAVAFEDMYRGGAVANLYDGVTSLTVYEYLFPKNCELLCAGEFIYCTEEKLDELVDFYNKECGFSYQYRFTNNASPSYMDMEMTDDMFLGLINFEEEYVTNSDEYSGLDVEYSIIQTADDSRLERTLNVLIDSDGTIMVTVISNPLSRNQGEYADAACQFVVTNPEAVKLLHEIGEAVKSEK